MSTEEVLKQELRYFVEPLVAAIDDQEALADFLLAYGYDLRSTSLTAIFQSIDGAAAPFKTAVEKLVSSDALDSNDLPSLVNSIFSAPRMFSEDPALRAAISSAGTLIVEISSALTDVYLSRRVPFLAAALRALGIIVKTEVKPTDAGGRDVTYIKVEFQWRRLSLLLSNVRTWAKDVYGWDGDPAEGDSRFFDYEMAIANIAYLIEASGLALSYYRRMAPLEVDAFLQNSGGAPIFETAVPILQDDFDHVEPDGTPVFTNEAGLKIVPFGDLSSVKELGLALAPYAKGQIEEIYAITPNVDLLVGVSGAVAGGLILALQPHGLRVVEAASTALSFAFGLHYRRDDLSDITLLGSDTATRLQSKDLSIGLNASLSHFQIEGGSEGAKLVLVKGEGDGFLNKVLPENPLIIAFDLILGLSNTRGLYFRGSAGLAITLAIHKDLFGVLKIETIDLAILAKGVDTAVKLELLIAASAALNLGPFHATVERIGLRGDLTFPESGGNLGIANLALRFKPPDGAGMSLKAKAVTGGGYLFFDPDNGQYAGILHLAVQDKIALTVIGLLTTRLPDGRKGFSLLLIITAEFPPIQLGYGFVLLGVGGLIGVHRTMVVDALRAGVKGGGLNSILFPQNPVENAQKIISDLKTFFPPAENRFTFGPMVKIAWGGAYPLLTIDLGILIELPAPVRVALLGRITLALPKREQPEDKVIVHIQMDILGVLDFEKSDLSIDATLFDSSIATFPLTGDMALRFNWGANPDFALSAGGFHPAYNPPPGFPVLGRLALSIASGDNPRIRAESYLAVTTAAAMMGASVELYAERDFGGLIGKFSVQAHLGFDALVRFVPFSFVVDMGADASLRRNNEILFAVALRLTLSGPQPWDARGYARFDFLGRHEIPFALTVGAEPEPAPLSISRPIDDLVAEVAKASNWTAQMPAGGQSVVSLREMERDPKVILAHPLGRVTFRQQIVPLQTEISRYGETHVSGPRKFDLAIELGGQAAPLPSMIRDNFAPGMFSELSDEAKLGEPAFVALPSGYQGIGLADSRAIFGHSTTKTFAYDEVVIDNLEARDRTRNPRFQLAADLLDRAALVGAAAVADLRTTGAAAFAGPDDQRVTLLEPAYVVADTDTLAATDAAAASHYEAKLERQREGKNSAQRQVVGKYEAR